MHRLICKMEKRFLLKSYSSTREDSGSQSAFEKPVAGVSQRESTARAWQRSADVNSMIPLDFIESIFCKHPGQSFVGFSKLTPRSNRPRSASGTPRATDSASGQSHPLLLSGVHEFATTSVHTHIWPLWLQLCRSFPRCAVRFPPQKSVADVMI
jgi:hypothetical protein